MDDYETAPFYSLEAFAGSSNSSGDDNIADCDFSSASVPPLFQSDGDLDLDLSMHEAGTVGQDQSHQGPPIKVYSSLQNGNNNNYYYNNTNNHGDLGNFDDADGSTLLLQQSAFPQEGSNGPNNHNEYNNDLLSPANYAKQQRSNSQPQRHRRTSSASSAPVPSLDSSASSFASSPAGGFQHHPHHSLPSSRPQFPPTPNLDRPLPTPEHTPVQGSFAEGRFDSYDPCSRGDADVAKVDMEMRRAMLEQQQRQQSQVTADGDAHFPYSLAPSTGTSLNTSGAPATPQTNNLGDFEGISHADYGLNSNHSMPKFTRTNTDRVEDVLYNPPMAAVPHSQPAQPPQPAADGHPFGSYRNLINDRLQAAHQGHMAGVQGQPDGARQTSPFRQGSQYAPPTSAYRTTQLQQPSQLASELPQSSLSGMDVTPGEPKTISPKDALLEFNESPEEGNAPLFPSQAPAPPHYTSTIGQQQPQQQQQQLPQQPQQQQPQASLSTGQQRFMGMDQYRNQYGRTTQPQQQYYMPHPLQQQLQRQQPQQQQQQPQKPNQQFPHPQQRAQQLPPPLHQQQQMPASNGSRLMNQTPDFPPSIPSIPSTNSPTSTTDDAFSTGHRAQDLTSSPVELAKRAPEGTSSDSGTYSCTYHGCTLRFETPARLQKHKRDAHRQTTPGSQGIVRDGSVGAGGAAQSLAARNSQAGPHRCDRINPTTGKPCNSIFSRPYDLTRHEDTIHNARKQKVHCHICTEEKSFSRNDALTRHMRVVHPDVNWSGKQKRKGRD